MVFARAYAFAACADSQEVKSTLAAVNPGSLVQVVLARSVKNELLAEMMVAQTFSAESSGSLLAKKLEMDLLLRLAGTTQIARAIKTHGAVAGKGFLAINAARSELAVPGEFRNAELPRRALTKSELGKVERAALLSARR